MFDLVWVAQFKDGSQLEQYKFVNEKYEETPFKEVLNRQDDLQSFLLINRAHQTVYIADLINGCIKFAPLGVAIQQPRIDMLRKDDLKYRLIYFREVERTFGNDLKEIGEAKVLFFVGFQHLDSNGFNQKRLMKIHPNGTWIIN